MTRGGDAKRGFTLVELLVAMAVLAIAGGALAAMQLGALRTSRTAQVRHHAAALVSDELIARQLLAGATGGACIAVALPEGWSCQVTTWCLPTAPPCSMVVYQVELVPLDGDPLVARGARFEPLLGRP